MWLAAKKPNYESVKLDMCSSSLSVQTSNHDISGSALTAPTN